jgi:hypothetical protein
MLTPTGDSYTANICFSYTDAELDGLNESNLHLCRWTGTAWGCLNRGAGSNTETNWVCADSVMVLSDWVMGDIDPTAVTLRSFNASGKATASVPYAWPVALAGTGVCLVGVGRLRRQRPPSLGQLGVRCWGCGGGGNHKTSEVSSDLRGLAFSWAVGAILSPWQGCSTRA